jgi:hypothetical protein
MKKIIIFLIFLMSLLSCGYDYKDVTYSGYVYDAETNEPIEGMVVSIHTNKHGRAITDTEGYYYAKMNVDCVYATDIDAGSFIYMTENFSLDGTTCDNPRVKHDFYLEHYKDSELTFKGTVYENGTSNIIVGATIYLSNSEIIPGEEVTVLSDSEGKFSLSDRIDYVTDLYIHGEMTNYKNYSKPLNVVEDWGDGNDIYLEVAP